MAYGRAARASAPVSEYRLIVGAETQPPAQQSSGGGWWKLAIGAAVFVGAGYALTRSQMVKDGSKIFAEASRHMREVGIKKGMSESEKNQLWDAYYAKKGLKLEDGELVKISKGS